MSERPPTNDFLPQSDREAQQIYAHVHHLVQTEAPALVIDNFRRLFIEGRDYQEFSVRSTLQKIVLSKGGDREFKLILYQSCQIIINYWYQEPKLQVAISELLALFEHLPYSLISASRLSNRWQQLVKDFIETEPYLKLKKLIKVVDFKWNEKINTAQYLGDLLCRFPYLYKHCLLDEDCNIDYQRTIRKISAYTQRDYEVIFAQYLTYQMRLIQVARARQLTSGAGRLLKRVENPTLLSGDGVKAALIQFANKTPRGYTIQNLSLEFLTHQKTIPTYKIFKETLYEYLISIIDPEYGKHRFNQQLYDKIKSILADCHTQKLSEFLMLRTYIQLLNFLVVESQQNLSHYIFTDLVTNLGITQATGFFLKLILLYPKLKPHLESRLAILFEHYQLVECDRISWFIKILENFQIAFSIHFGKLDLSALKLYSDDKIKPKKQ